MYYPPRRIRFVPRRKQSAVSDRVESEVVPRVPIDRWQDTDEYLPLRHSTGPAAISLALFPHCTGTLQNDAVYVLECLKSHAPATSRACYTIQAYWKREKVKAARRLIYVGRAANVYERLQQHLLDVEGGANFTQVYPPIRVLDVSWWRRASVGDAEKIVAEKLQERFPEDYIVQL